MILFAIKVQLNGLNYNIYTNQPFHVYDLLKFFNYQKELLILEYNGKIYNKLTQQSQCSYIKQNDKIEIITIVGGG